MSYFTKKVPKTYTFEGDTITLSMGRLKKKDAIRIAPMLGEPDDEGNFKIKFADQVGFISTASELLPKYISEFSGLKDADNNPISLEDICGEDGEAYFMTLISDIFSDLMDISFAKSEDEKKSDKGLANTLEDLGKGGTTTAA